MTLTEVEFIFGRDAVTAMELAVATALDSAERRGQRNIAQEALQELLVALLAASVISTPGSASSRARLCAVRLAEIVNEAQNPV